MKEVVIVAAVRTAVGKRNGQLAYTRADDMAAEVLTEVVKRAGVEKAVVDDVILGCVSQVGEQAGNIARTAALIAGFPIEVPGVTIDRQCGSSQQAVHFASQAIASGDMDIVIAGGIENMTRVPMGSSAIGVGLSEKLTDKYEIIQQGFSAERIAEKWGFNAQQLNEYAYESHKRAIESIDRGDFKKEIMPLQVKNESGDTVLFEVDEGPRASTTVEILNKLKPSFQENGLITAGNSSPISDGASAVLLMSLEKAQELGIKPLAKVIARSVIGSDPTLMLTGPIAATKKVLKKAGLDISQIDTYEVNEAFAPVTLAWLKDLGADHAKLNVNGGAIALGHPLGASGTKLITTLIHRMQRENLKYGLVTFCEGGGMSNATIFEKM
ncbi:thiolase family protein [Kurthia sibirica]|uniref:Steroid 3-ketoacyl-CoA thiolase n=1 Tax=Kurthia sibirica TaxID=202750 RepID=A0A2U3APY1_9BACL|nr:thiolase family protein [Kurthia sibirica]PWI26515.1 steroid 3-ketoacyl-CoA thiolase [Kurthia sibirica]GEK32759.1 acyl-CoA dehydrogenase [Kurthia sibirica]